MAIDSVRNDFNESLQLLSQLLDDDKYLQAINCSSDAIAEAYKTGNKIISCGNGGSMTDAMHLAEEFSGRFRNNRESLPALAISDPSYLTCTANDFGFDFVFSRFVEGFGKAGDVFFAISTSGNSVNVVNAAIAAKSKGLTVIGLTGKTGGKLAPLCDIEIRVPHNGFSDRIQEMHILIIHSIVNNVERKLNLS